MPTMAVRCSGACGDAFLVEDLDAARLGLEEPVRTVHCPRLVCRATTVLDAASWLKSAQRASAQDMERLPRGMLELRGARDARRGPG